MKSVLIEGSARHVHVSKEDLAVLFGEGYQLHLKRELSQPGEFLTDEKVRLEGPRGGIDRASILGPERKATQVEISLTDARSLGIEPPVRMSGDLAGSAPIRIVGPAGTLDLKEGCVIAKRHIHVTPTDAEELNIGGRETVNLRIAGERGLVFSEVCVRISEKFATAVHLDYDEMNASGLSGTGEGFIE